MSGDRIVLLQNGSEPGLEQQLSEAGLVVEEASIDTTVELVAGPPPAALLLSCRADAAALELFERLRIQEGQQELLIVLLLDEAGDLPGPSECSSGLQAGVDLCLPRALPQRRLVAQLQSLLQRRHVLLVARDEQARAERLLRQLARMQRLATIGKLAAGVAHELSNPLTYLLHDLGVLDEELPKLARAATLKRPPKPEQLEAAATQLRSAHEAAQRMHDVVRDLRQFIDAGDELATVSLNDLVDGALSLVFGEIRFRARLVKNYRTLPMVRASRGSLGQLLLELLLDVARAAGGGEVSVRTQVVEERVRLELVGSGEHRIELAGPERMAVYQQLVEASHGALYIEHEEQRLSYVVELPL